MDYLCLITPLIGHVEIFLQKLKIMLENYVMEMENGKTLRIYVGKNLNHLFIEIYNHEFNRMSSFSSLWLSVYDSSLAYDTVKLNIMKAKRQLPKLRLNLRSNALLIRIQAKLVKTFVKVATQYDLPIVRWMVID